MIGLLLRFATITIIELALLLLIPIRASALAPPHDVSNQIGCKDCHAMHSGGMMGWGVIPRGAEQESMCKSCHNPTGQASSMTDVANHDGVDCGSCHDAHSPDTTTDTHTGGVTADNLKLIRSNTAKYIAQALEPAIFQTRPDHFSFDTAPYNGICQTCHSDTSHHRNDGTDPDHNAGTVCTSCHTHGEGFAAGATGPAHDTHLNLAKGPQIDCSDCHIQPFQFDPVIFADGQSLADTTVCDDCHSPGGSYDGVDDPVVGAKNNWPDGVYTSGGSVLQSGKEKWCAGCHDESPSIISGVSAPPVIGDETESYTYGTGWGYYKTGHGLPDSQTYTASGGMIPGAGLTCAGCHDFTAKHIDGVVRTYNAAASDGSADDYQHGYRIKSIDGQQPMDIPRIDGCESGVFASDFRLCFSCHESGAFTNSSDYNTNFMHTGSPDFNAHYYHLSIQDDCGAGPKADTDWDGTVDSRVTCITCHNVHGSPQLTMIRDGSLIGREPGLRIVYYNDDVSFECGGSSPYDPLPPDKTLLESTGAVWDQDSASNLCSTCHGSCGWDTVYSRPPGDFWAPRISAAFGAAGDALVAVRFNEGVYGSPDASGDLAAADFDLTDSDDGRIINSVSHTAGDLFAYLTLSSPLDETDDLNVDTVAAATGTSIYDVVGNAMATTAVVIEGDEAAPSVSDEVPANGAVDVVVNTDVTFTLTDTGSGIEWTTFSIQLSGNSGYSETYTDADTSVVTKTGSPAQYDVTVDPDTDFGYNETITVTVNVSDAFGNAMTPAVWSFTTIEATTPQTRSIHPSGVANPYGFTTFPSDSWSTVLDSNDGLSSYAHKCGGAGYPSDSTSRFSVDMDDWATTGEPNPSTIQSITVNVVAKYAPSCPTSGTATGTMAICYRTGTNTVCSDIAVSGDFTLYSSPSYSTDSDGGALDLTDIDNIQVEIQRKSSGSIHLIATEVNVDISYLP